MALNKLKGKQLKEEIAGAGIGIDAAGNYYIAKGDGIDIVDDLVTVKPANPSIIVSGAGIQVDSDYTIKDTLARTRFRGFIDRSEVTISLSGTQKDVFNIVPADTTFRYIFAGELITVAGAGQISLPNIGGGNHTNGLYYIYFDDNQAILRISMTEPDNELVCPIAIVLWCQSNTSGKRSLLLDNTHTMRWPASIQQSMHKIRGTQRLTGALISGYTKSVASDSAVTFSLSESILAMEDITLILSELIDGNGTGANYTIMYRDSGGDWAWTQGSNFPFVNAPSGRLYRNLDTGLEECSDNIYTNSYVCVTNIKGEARFIIIPSPNEHETPNAAFSETFTSLGLNLILPEFVCIYQLTWKTSDIYTNTGKCSLERALDQNISVAEANSIISAITVANIAPVPGYIVGSRIGYVNSTTVKSQAGMIEIGGLTYQSSNDILIPWSTAEDEIVQEADTWYNVYAKQDPNVPDGWIPFISAELPTRNQFGQTVSSDFDGPKYHPTLLARFIGAFVTDENNEIIHFSILGNYVAYIGRGYNYILQGGNSTSRAAINCRSLVPKTSSLAQIYYEFQTGNNIRYIGDATSWYLKSTAASGSILLPVTNDAIYYQATEKQSASLGVHGYYETI